MSRVSLIEYESKVAIFEKSLDETYKKNNGIFYTDVKLSRLILDYLNIDKNSSIFDPCCGAGSFLYVALEYGYQNIYGADLDGNAVKLCRILTGLSSTIKKLDTIGNDSKMILKTMGLKAQADYIIGNPPYCPIEKNIIINTNDYLFQRNVKDSGNNLFIAALYRSFDLVKKGGIISYIIPKNFLHVCSYGPLRKYILHNKTIISIVDIGTYFSNVRGEQILITIENDYKPDNKIQILKFIDDSFKEKCIVNQKFYADEILLFNSNEEFTVYCKLEETYMKFSDICTGYVGRGKSKSTDAINGRDIRKFGFKNRSVPDSGNQVFIQNIYSAESGIIASFAGNELEAKETVTIFTDGDEKMCRYMVGILHSRLCNFYLLKFCYNSSKLTMHTDAKYLNKLPLRKDNHILFDQIVNLVKAMEKIDYLTEIWFEMLEELNKLVYEMYGISDYEIRYIDNEMKSLQSKRWLNDK